MSTPAGREAEQAARTVLAPLGAHLVGQGRAELAARLPIEAALVLTGRISDADPPTG